MGADSNMKWNLDSIYTSPDSREYKKDIDSLTVLSDRLRTILADNSDNLSAEVMPEILALLGRLEDLLENLESYITALWSVDTGNSQIQKERDLLEEKILTVKDAQVSFRAALAGMSEKTWNSLISDSRLQNHVFYLKEEHLFASHQMCISREALSSDLQRSSADAWERLHDRIASSAVFNGKTISELRALAYHPDRKIRRKAWEDECACWKENEIPLAAALNGVKGWSVTINASRGWKNTLERSLAQNRITRTALDAMLNVMNKSLPVFRRYFNAKAVTLGLEKLSWYDLFAPLDKASWSWEQCRDFIPSMFDTLSKEMGDFARNAFENSWIDAKPGLGKVGGAYCTTMPLAGESRILCNFDGSFDSVSTVAHELGHAWHSEVLKNHDALSRRYPMTLAETASIFSETLVFRAALNQASSNEALSRIDTYMTGASQVIVDILCRFNFESALIKKREKGELCAEELCELMLECQEETYGNALHPKERHPWMWAVKGHYYSADVAFYNFPYAFGELFSLGLYSRYLEDGKMFAEDYSRLLEATGSHNAADVARIAGFDIETTDFWQKGIDVLADLVSEFENLAGKSKN